MLSTLQKVTGKEELACQVCGSRMQKRWYTQDRFSYACSNPTCGNVM